VFSFGFRHAHHPSSFNVHGVIYVNEEGRKHSFVAIWCRIQLPAETVAPIEREIRDFANGLKSVKDEQEYLVVRERRHRNTAESTNSRVKWWSILQAIVLFAAVGWQVYYLKVRSCVRGERRCSDMCFSLSSKSNGHFESWCMVWLSIS
jgi:hypothetical protein